MNSYRARILIGFLLLGFVAAPAHAVLVNKQNQVIAQPEEKITVTYLSVSAAHHDQILNIYTPTAQFTIDTASVHAGNTVTVGSFSRDTEIIFQLMDPRTGFSFYNDPRNNVDLANHIRITDLGSGKLQIGWQLDTRNGNYDDLVILVQKSSAPAPSVAKKKAAPGKAQKGTKRP